MPYRRRFLRPLVLIGSGALVAGTLAAAPARASGPTTGVTVLLKAPNSAGLKRLAAASGLTHAQRMAALAPLLPGPAAHRQVVTALQADGFTIDHETAWTVDATAPQTAVADAFGGVSRLRAAALPAIPPVIAGVTAAVLPSTGPTGVFTAQDDCPATCRDGVDLRNAYTAPGVPPDAGHDSKATLTIASLQFADWNASDLSKYGTAVGTPLASGQYQQIPVKGSTVSGASTAQNGLDEEVDLDQEALLATDPYANQRAYFDTNSTRGYIQSLSQVLADVTQGQGRVDGGDPHIVALSTSWGSCENDFNFNFPGDTKSAIERLLQSLSAAGVTIFAASGDDGVYDCGLSKSSTQVAVDYPASSPEVVGVGGTRLTPIGGNAANDGSNWDETGWTCASTAACEAARGTGGSGGGESNTYPMPTYQSLGIGHHRFRTSTGIKGDFGSQPHRLVPDIAADGDPKTGFDILTSDPVDACQASVLPPVCQQLNNPSGLTTTVGVGGTSLAAPVSAALFTTMLAAHGVTSGVGDIHGALYSAYAAHNGAFRDVTTGSNGHQQDVDVQASHHKAADLPVSARTGYDTVTGLGAPYWERIAPYLFAAKSAQPSASLRLRSPHSQQHPTRVKAHWSSHLAGAGAAMLPAAARVTITEAGRAKPVYHASHAPTTGSFSFTANQGSTYTLTVADRDISGHRSAPTAHTLVVPYDDTSFTVNGKWSRVHSHRDFGGSHIVTTSKSASARAEAVGRRYAVMVRTGPAYGRLAIFHGASRVKVIDLFSTSPGRILVGFFGGARTAVKRRTFVFRETGTRSGLPSGTAVNLDGLAATR